MTIEEIQKEIDDLSGNNAKFYSNIVPGAKPTHGVRIPELRKVAKRIAKEDYRYFLDNNPMDSFEMETLQAFVIGYAKDDIHILLDYVDQLIPLIHDWAVCDSLCQGFKIARRFPNEVFHYLEKFYDSHEEFEVRVVAVTLMSHFLTDDYIDEVIRVINHIYSDTYYAKMGIAWAVATIMAKYPDKCLEYMEAESNQLDDWTYNKAIQKMQESYRVSDHMKSIMKQKRRKV